MPRPAVDLVVSLDRLHGSFVVASIEDAARAQLFAYRKGGGFQRSTAPSFARTVQESGYGAALSSVLQ